MNVNTVVVAGLLLEDPQLRRTKNGFAVTTALLEVKRQWEKDGQPKEEVSTIEVDVFGRSAENLCQYLKKGDPVLFDGHMKLEQWKDAQGQDCARLIVVADTMQFVSTKEGGGGGNRRSQSTAERP